MEKKILIISKNNLSKEFWKIHLRMSNIAIQKCKDQQTFQEKLQQFVPDVLIIDDYFNPKGGETWMMNQVSKILEAGFDKMIYCLSPIYNIDEEKREVFTPQVKKHGFSNSFLEYLNQSLGGMAA